VIQAKTTVSSFNLATHRLKEEKIDSTQNTAPKQLIGSEENFHRIIDHACEGIIIHIEDKIQYVNQKLVDMLAYESPSELIGSTVSELVSESRRSISRELEKSMLEDAAELPSIEEVYIRKDGTPLSVEVSVLPIQFNGVKAVQIIARDITERKKVEAEIWEYQNMLKRVSSDLILAEESEKRKLAIILHDHLGQSLAMARIKITGLMGDLQDEDQLDKLRAIEDDITTAVKQTRSLTNDLSPPVLHELGLIVALKWRLEKFTQERGLETSYVHDVDHVNLRAEQSIILFRSTDELLSNVVKHSGASSVDVSISTDAFNLMIMVSDNGKGFDLSVLDPEKRRNDSFGLFSIKERLEYLGGVLDIRSEPNRGTQVILSIPVASGGE